MKNIFIHLNNYFNFKINGKQNNLNIIDITIETCIGMVLNRIDMSCAIFDSTKNPAEIPPISIALPLEKLIIEEK